MFNKQCFITRASFFGGKIGQFVEGRSLQVISMNTNILLKIINCKRPEYKLFLHPRPRYWKKRMYSSFDGTNCSLKLCMKTEIKGTKTFIYQRSIRRSRKNTRMLLNRNGTYSLRNSRPTLAQEHPDFFRTHPSHHWLINESIGQNWRSHRKSNLERQMTNKPSISFNNLIMVQMTVILSNLYCT